MTFFGGAADKVGNATSIGVSPNATVSAGFQFYVFVGTHENTSNDHTSVSDTQGNTYVKLGTANNGGNIVASLWFSKLATALTTSDTVTATFDSSGARAIGLEGFSLTAGQTKQVAGSNTASGSGNNPTTTLSGLSAVSRRWVAVTAWEGAVSAFSAQDLSYLPSTGDAQGTTGGGAANNLGVTFGLRDHSNASDTYDISLSSSRPFAQVLVALDEVAEVTNGRADIAWVELEVPTPDARADVAWAEFETPVLNARADVSWAELETPVLDARADVAWAELETPVLDAQAEVAWAELEIPILSGQAEVAWAELEIPVPNAQAEVAWAEFEAPFAQAQAEIAWAELETPLPQAQAEVSWAELETPFAQAQAEVAWAEVEVPVLDAQAEVAWAELETPVLSAQAEIAWAEVEVPTPDAQAEVAWAEFQTPDPGVPDAQAEVAWAEVEVPPEPARAEVAWAELETPVLDARAEVAWAEVETPLAPAQGEVAWLELEVPPSDRQAEIAWAELELPLPPAQAEVAWTVVEAPLAVDFNLTATGSLTTRVTPAPQQVALDSTTFMQDPGSFHLVTGRYRLTKGGNDSCRIDHKIVVFVDGEPVLSVLERTSHFGEEEFVRDGQFPLHLIHSTDITMEREVVVEVQSADPRIMGPLATAEVWVWNAQVYPP